MTDWMKEIRERCKNATPGPWESGLQYLIAGVNDGSNPYWIPSNIPHGKCTFCESFKLTGIKEKYGANYHVHANVAENSSIVSPSSLSVVTAEDSGLSEEDAEFIAHAREDIPNLLDEVERLKSIISGIHNFAMAGYEDAENSTEERVYDAVIREISQLHRGE